MGRRSLTRGASRGAQKVIVAGVEPWQRAGVSEEDWVAARLLAAALMRAVDRGDPDAVAFVLTRRETQDTPG